MDKPCNDCRNTVAGCPRHRQPKPPPTPPPEDDEQDEEPPEVVDGPA